MTIRWPRLGLRMRATIGFGLTALLVAIGLAATTFTVARGYLVTQREGTAIRQTYVNARLVRTVLRNADADVAAFLSGLGGDSASNSVVRYRGEWYSTSVAIGAAALPKDLVATVAQGDAGHQRFKDPSGQLNLVVGVSIAATGADYFEVFALDELNRTLSLLSRALMFGVLAAALIAAGVGRASANRLVRPLGPVADAAEKIAGGALDTRLEDLSDPDLDRLVHAFNSMAAALEERIEREARFAADVSHELRSPLTAIAAAIEIIGRRRDQMPAPVVEAFIVLSQKTERFQQMVLDLLEISRMDAGSAAMSVGAIDTREFITRLAALHGVERDAVRVDASVPSQFRADRRRIAQAMGNLMDNARNYAGGVTGVAVTYEDPARIRFTFDDRGPGVSSDEKLAIFGRFSRGEAGMNRGSSSGTGLGLALVAEHVRLHEGKVWVEDNPEGGARFVVEIPSNARD